MDKEHFLTLTHLKSSLLSLLTNGIAANAHRFGIVKSPSGYAVILHVNPAGPALGSTDAQKAKTYNNICGYVKLMMPDNLRCFEVIRQKHVDDNGKVHYKFGLIAQFRTYAEARDCRAELSILGLPVTELTDELIAGGLKHDESRKETAAMAALKTAPHGKHVDAQTNRPTPPGGRGGK